MKRCLAQRVLILMVLGGVLAAPLSVRAQSGFTDQPDIGDEDQSQLTGPPPLPTKPPQDDQTVNVDGSVTIRLGPANIQTFFQPTLQNLSRAYMKLTGVDMSDDKLIDDFGAINYCPLFKKYYTNEFIWRQAREVIRKTILDDMETYPENFVLSGTLKMGRYDFDRHAFLLDRDNDMDHTGRFDVVLKQPDDCYFSDIRHMPKFFIFRLINPVTLNKIPVPEDYALQITKEMDRRENSRRIVYVSFYFRINDFNSAPPAASGARTTTVRATLMSLRFYVNPERTFLIYDYRPR